MDKKIFCNLGVIVDDFWDHCVFRVHSYAISTSLLSSRFVGNGKYRRSTENLCKDGIGQFFSGLAVPDKLVHVPELGVDRHNLLTQLLHPIDIILSNNNIYNNNINNNNNKQQQLAIGP